MTAAVTAPTATPTCDPATRVTRSLLGYGVLAGPFYVSVALAQALTRPGFDLSRHPWSLLANGSLGWIQITNFVLTGLMVVAAAVGLRRALGSGSGARWAPRLVGCYGVALVAAGVLRADPMHGFPVGTPDGVGAISWHGIGHLVVGAIGFLCVIVACFVLARRFARAGRRGWAGYSRMSGLLFLAAFVGIASGGAAPALTLGFVAGVVVIFIWLAAVSVDAYRSVATR
jgi:hypothetical membrane protein